MTECEKIIKRDAFLKAIEIEDAPSAAEGLHVDSMVVDDSYDGVRLDKEMTEEFIEDMIERFKNGKKIHKKYVYQIILAVMDLVKKEPTMVETEVPQGHEITVCGDTHGKFMLSQPPLDGAGMTLTLQANSSTSWKSSASLANRPRNTTTSSTATLSTEAPGPPKSP